jgi:hypothetical protein
MELIIIFSKDRPITLSHSLNSVAKNKYPILVIDNSTLKNHQKEVSKLCDNISYCTYFGKSEYNNFLTTYEIDPQKYSFLIAELSIDRWNLGYTRNLALLFSKSQKAEKVLFMDEDINVPDISLIDYLFKELDNYKFVGSNITGLIDDSIVGHIATDLGIFNERMLSGGFMAFRPNRIDHFFLNTYNEDWIWLFLQLQGEKYLQNDNVFQELSDPLKNYKEKILFQEFGEIILDGILKLHPNKSYDGLLSQIFWIDILNERFEYLNSIRDNKSVKNKSYYKEIVEYVISNLKKFEASAFRNLFEKYFNNRNLFQKLFNSLT